MLEKRLKSLKIMGHFLWLFKHAEHINNSTNQERFYNRLLKK